MGSGCCRFRSSPARPVAAPPSTAAPTPASIPLSTTTAAARSEQPQQQKSDMDDLRESLQSFIGEKPRVEIVEFENFSKLVRAKVFLVKPKLVEEVQRVVRAAAQFKLKVRCSGATHSWSPLFADEGQLLIDGKDLDRQDGPKIQLNKRDANDGQLSVTMSSSVTLQELLSFFLEHHVCFESNAILRNVTVGGIISTGVHGVGWDQKTVSDWVTEMTLVDSSGNIRKFSKKDDPEAMSALQVSLGLCGVITEVTMQVLPSYNVTVDNWFDRRVYDYFFNPTKLRELVTNNWSVQLYWFPFESMDKTDLASSIVKGKVTDFDWNPMADRLWARVINRIEPGQLHLPPVKEAFHTGHRVRDTASTMLMRAKEKLGDIVEEIPFIGDDLVDLFQQRTDPTVLNIAFEVIKNQYGEIFGVTQEVPNAIHYRTYQGLTPVFDMEFAFDCPNTIEGFTTISRAIGFVVERVQSLANNGEYPLSATLEMRWIAHSDALLCPAVVGNPDNGGGGHTFYLEIVSFNYTEKEMSFFKEVFDYWISLPGSKNKPVPHWGKMWAFNGDKAVKFLQQEWGERIEKFKEIRDRLELDSDNVFTNEKLRELFKLN